MSTSPITLVNDTSSGRLKKTAIQGADRKRRPNKTTLNNRFVRNIVLQSSSDTCCFLIKELENPLSTMPVRIVVKMVTMPISPYSAGVRMRASTSPTRKVTPWPRKVSAALQPTPETVLSFREVSDIESKIQLVSLKPFVTEEIGIGLFFHLGNLVIRK